MRGGVGEGEGCCGCRRAARAGKDSWDGSSASGEKTASVHQGDFLLTVAVMSSCGGDHLTVVVMSSCGRDHLTVAVMSSCGRDHLTVAVMSSCGRDHLTVAVMSSCGGELVGDHLHTRVGGGGGGGGGVGLRELWCGSKIPYTFNVSHLVVVVFFNVRVVLQYLHTHNK